MTPEGSADELRGGRSPQLWSTHRRIARWKRNTDVGDDFPNLPPTIGSDPIVFPGDAAIRGIGLHEARLMW